ncbi:hypothetical protein [Flagellimonas flava]|uniref:hypothetical protein n=1 Tax=Flagellimonas flava TaxID=570519 RepID=UPI001041F8F8|nr:hypothetical protein [Allomuricauda flava]
MINPLGQIIDSKLLKLNEGIGAGTLDVPGDMSGRFLIRAYTDWNQNFGDDHIYTTYVNIYPLREQSTSDLFDDLKITRSPTGNLELSGKLNVGKKHEMVAHFSWNSGNDSILLNGNSSNTINLSYEIPQNTPWIQVAIQDINGFTNSKTFVLNAAFLDLQFFPESGKMIQGHVNRIGFKAVGFDGKGKKVKGAVFDNNGKEVALFESNTLGMGTLSLHTENNLTYHAKVFSTENVYGTMEFPLPGAFQVTSILSVNRLKDRVRFGVISNELNDSIGIKVSCRGKDYYMIEGLLQNNKLISELPLKDLPHGIVIFKLLDKGNKPIAERLFYNDLANDWLELAVSMDKKGYSKRDKTELDIRVLGNGIDSIDVNMSVLVLNKEEWREENYGTIQSYFYLESEIRGNIENPGWYFNRKNPTRLQDLDALLLTQGWRNYKYPSKRKTKQFFWPQKGLTIRGKLTSTLSNIGKNENRQLSLATFGQKMAFYTSGIDSLGNFSFHLEESYGKDMRILLYADAIEKRKKSQRLSIETVPKPKVVYNQDSFGQKIDTISKILLGNQRKRQRMEMVFDSLYGVTQLEEVVVEDVWLNPQRQKIYKRHGKPDVIISGDSLVKKEQNWSHGLYSILMFNYRGEVMIEQFSDGFMLPNIPGGPTLIMVDGKLLSREDYRQAAYMPPKNIMDIEIIKFANSFKHSFLEVFPETHPMNLPPAGHIISITTKGKVGIYASERAKPGTLDTTIQIFSPVKEFYAPKYLNPVESKEEKPDLRSLIHWKADLKTDHSGRATESFYNGDVTGDYIIVIEAISQKGEIGYQHQVYTIE